VTRIVSMSARERRGIIDELAGVALFDTRIDQSRSKLDEVRSVKIAAALSSKSC
jgi:chromosome segregation protein